MACSSTGIASSCQTAARMEPVDNAVRDLLELLIVVSLVAILVAAVVRLRRGDVRVYRCVACGRPTSRGYPRCKHCGVEQPDAI